MKRIVKFLKESLVNTGFSFIVGIFILGIFTLIIEKKYRKKLTSIIGVFFEVHAAIILFYGVFILLAIPFVGLLSYYVDKLSSKYSYFLSVKNKSKSFNFFFVYLIKGFIGSIFIILSVFSTMKFYSSKFSNIKIFGRYMDRYSIYILFLIIYFFIFYFLADKIISFYKKKKSVKA